MPHGTLHLRLPRVITAGLAAILLALGVASSAGTAPAAAATAGAPNVLVLNADDWRSDPAGISMRSYMPKTWAWLNGSAAVYPQSEVSNPNCCPSRASLMTGRYDHNNGVKTQADGLKLDFNSTIQHYLHTNGYQTGLVGKFLNSFPQNQSPPDFDYFAMWEVSDYLPPFATNVNGHGVKATKYASTYFGDRVMDALTKFAAKPGRPWYLYGAVHAPHTTSVRQPDGSIQHLAIPEPKYANAPVPACLQPGEADVSDQPKYVSWVHLDAALLRKICTSQMRAMMSVDDAYDRAFSYLANSGQLSHTLVVVTSDNGLLWGEHNREGKFVPFLPSVRVPLLVRWDGHLAPGTNNNLVSNVDLAPTILQAAGLSANPAVPMDGHSLLSGYQRHLQLNEYWYDIKDGKVPTWAQIHTDTWAYNEYYKADGSLMSRAYYNLASDPGENLNLLGDRVTSNDPPNLSQLAAQLAATKRCVGTACP
jgi:N-acetylglucosamine-6-sulfatase